MSLSTAPPLPASLVRAWVRLYTRGLAPQLRAARREEIDGDLWEQTRETAVLGGTPSGVRSQVLLRLLLGMPADVSWRVAQIGTHKRDHRATGTGELRMSSPNWIRGSGLVAIMGGMLWAGLWAYMASRPVAETLENILTVVAMSLFVVALTAMYFQQPRRVGLIGTAGLALLWSGLGLVGAWVLDIVSPWLFFIGGLLTWLVGLVLFGLAMLRAKVIPLTVAAAFIVALVLFAFVNADDWRAVLAVPLGLAWVWLGYSLWRRARGESGA